MMIRSFADLDRVKRPKRLKAALFWALDHGRYFPFDLQWLAGVRITERYYWRLKCQGWRWDPGWRGWLNDATGELR